VIDETAQSADIPAKHIRDAGTPDEINLIAADAEKALANEMVAEEPLSQTPEASPVESPPARRI
jgi:hypothetical protein